MPSFSSREIQIDPIRTERRACVRKNRLHVILEFQWNFQNSGFLTGWHYVPSLFW